MAAFSPSADKIITSKTANLADAAPLDSRDFIARLLLDLGFSKIVGANIAPTDTSVLWWHIDIKQAKRFNPVLGNWYPLTAELNAIHQFQRLILAVSSETTLDDGDVLPFWDVSVPEAKKVTMAAFSSQVIRRITISRRFFYNTVAGPVTHTLPATPSDGDTVEIFDKGGNFRANNLTIARNGKTIYGASENLICNRRNIGVELQYFAADGDWKPVKFFGSAVK